MWWLQIGLQEALGGRIYFCYEDFPTSVVLPWSKRMSIWKYRIWLCELNIFCDPHHLPCTLSDNLTPMLLQVGLGVFSCRWIRSTWKSSRWHKRNVTPSCETAIDWLLFSLTHCSFCREVCFVEGVTIPNKKASFVRVKWSCTVLLTVAFSKIRCVVSQNGH